MTIRDDLAGPSMRKARRSRRGAGRACKAKPRAKQNTQKSFMLKDTIRRAPCFKFRMIRVDLAGPSIQNLMRSRRGFACEQNHHTHGLNTKKRRAVPGFPPARDRPNAHLCTRGALTALSALPRDPAGRTADRKARNSAPMEPSGFQQGCGFKSRTIREAFAWYWTRNRNRKVFGEHRSPEPRTTSASTQAHVLGGREGAGLESMTATKRISKHPKKFHSQEQHSTSSGFQFHDDPR